MTHIFNPHYQQPPVLLSVRNRADKEGFAVTSNNFSVAINLFSALVGFYSLDIILAGGTSELRAYREDRCWS